MDHAVTALIVSPTLSREESDRRVKEAHTSSWAAGQARGYDEGVKDARAAWVHAWKLLLDRCTNDQLSALLDVHLRRRCLPPRMRAAARLAAMRPAVGFVGYALEGERQALITSLLDLAEQDMAECL